MTKSIHDPFVLLPPPKLSLLLGTWSDYIVKITKLLYSIKAGSHRVNIYHLYNKDKIVINPIWTFVCAADYLNFGCNLNSLGNLSTAFFFTHNSGTYAIEPDIVTEKGKPPKTLSIYMTGTIMPCSRLLPLYFSHRFQPPALFFNLTFASFPLLADNSLVKLTSKASLNFSCPV